MRIGIAIHRAALMDATWTTVHLAWAALARGHLVRFIEHTDFELDRTGRLVARAHVFDQPLDTPERLGRALARRDAGRRTVDVERLDLLLLRMTPLEPAVHTFALLAKERGVRVVNDPDGAQRVSSKAWLAAHPQIPSPQTLVTRSAGAVAVFHAQEPDGVVVKPARGSGGRCVFHVKRGDRDGLMRAFEEARSVGDGYVVLQGYLRAADDGEKRLLWLDGDIIGGYLRRRAPGDFRHNLKRGGVAAPAEITDSERNLATRLSPLLLATGVRFAGLDVIGGVITEINALNPGGTVHADRLSGTRLADLVVARLEQQASTSRPAEQKDDPWAHPVP